MRVVGLHPGATKTERKISQPQARVAKELGMLVVWEEYVAK